MESTCTPKSSQSRFISQGCKKHTRLRHRPLQFTHDFTSVQQSAHSNSSLASLFEESSLCSSLGEIDTSWFDSERWTSNDETKWKKEDILKTPQASQRESKVFTTPGLFTPDRPSPVCKQCKDYPECNPPPDEESASSSFIRPKRFRKVPSSIHTTPNSQIITSHQPTSGPTTETIQEEGEGESGPADVRFSPFPTWNPTYNKDTPIFMKQLFKTPSTLFGGGDKRACSTPLQRLSTPQRLSRSLGAEPDESDLSWTSSLATPPMSSKSTTVTSSNKKYMEDDTWQTHVVAKVLFQDAGSVVETDSCEEGDEGSTQPLKVIKLPSINDDSQEEEFTIETEDGGESDKSVADGRKEIPAPMDNMESDESKTKMVAKDSPAPPSTSVQPPMTDNGKPHLAKHQEHDSISECADLKKVSEQCVLEGVSAREKVQGPSVDSAAELNANVNVSGDSPETSAPSELDRKLLKKNPSPIQPAMSSQQSSIIDSYHASQTLFNSQESTKNDKTAMEETLAFLLATPPSRREKLLNRLGASGSSIGASITLEEGACDALGSTLNIKNDSSVSRCSAPTKSVLDDTLMSPAGLLWKPARSGSPDVGRERKSFDSKSSMNEKPNDGVVETPSRPAPDVDLLSPISPNYAEALCRVTDIASREQPIGNKNTLTGKMCLGVERNLIGNFENPYSDETRSHIKVTDQLRSEGLDDPLEKKTLHPTKATELNALAVENSSSFPSSLPASEKNKLPKAFLSKQETNKAMSTSKLVAVANLNTQTVTKGRFKYTTPAPTPKKEGGSISKTPSWLSRAVYVEEEEEEKEEKKGDAVQAETMGESSKKGWTMKRPCRTKTSFTTFSTFCKTAPNPPTRAIPTAQSQTALTSSTTPTSSRSVIQSAPPHNKTLVRIREIPHSWPSPKRLRLDEERDECNVENDMQGHPPAVEECEVEIPKSTPPGSDVKSPHTQNLVSLDIDDAMNGQEGVEDLHEKFSSMDHVSSTVDVHDMTQNVGFSSASGRAIFVSSEALKKAEKLIEDVDKEKAPEEFQLNLSSGDHQCGFQSASGKSIRVSDEALTKAKKIMDEVDLSDETIHDSTDKSSPSVGFTSARGNVINVSAAAMAKARKIMNDINQDEEPTSIVNEEREVEIAGHHHVDGGGDGNVIQNKGVHNGGVPGNAQLNRTVESRQRHKGFRPFKPPSLVANMQKPYHLTSRTSIPSLNPNSAIDLIKESDRGNSLKMCEDSIPGDLQAPQRTAAMPELEITTLQQEQKMETSESSKILREKQKLDSVNVQSIENSDIAEDDCLSATQAAREIKAAEEMELVYNFMQEEDTGFSQLDVSSIMAAGRSEKGSAQSHKCPEYHKDPNKESQAPNSQNHQMFNHIIEPTSSQGFLNEQSGNFIALESQLQKAEPIGTIKVPTERNEVLPASIQHNYGQFKTDFVKNRSFARTGESKENISSSNHTEKKPSDLKRNGDYSKDETDTNRESPVADLSVKVIGLVMGDNSILTNETDRVCTLIVKDKEQQEKISHIDSHGQYQGNTDDTEISNSTQRSRCVRDVDGFDESLSKVKDEAHISGDHLQPDILNATSYPENDSMQDQEKRDKSWLKMDATLEACGPIGFKTAGGQKIEVSESALQKATLMLSDRNLDEKRNEQVISEISDQSFNQLIPTLLAHDMRTSHVTSQENMELPKHVKVPECRPLINVLQGKELLIGYNSDGSIIRDSSVSAEEPVSSSVSEVCQVGLQTTGGKDMEVSDSALHEAKILVGDNHEENPVDYAVESEPAKDIPGSNQDSVNLGFQTARGNKVYVSSSALQKARKIIESAMENVPDCSPGRSSMMPQNTTDSKTAFCTMKKHDIIQSEQVPQKYSSQSGLSPKGAALEMGSKDSVTLSGDSACRTEPFLSECNAVSGTLSNTESGLLVAFHTASGNKINISDDALQKARRLVCNEMRSFDEDAIGKSTKGSDSKQDAQIDMFENISRNLGEISEASLLEERQHIASHTDLCTKGDTDNSASINRDVNSNIPFSKARLQRTMHDDSLDNSSGQKGSDFTPNSSPRNIGFKTARGGAISVSDESLKKAKQLLGEDSLDGNVQEISGIEETVFESFTPMTGFRTGSGKLIHVSEPAIQVHVGKKLVSNGVDSCDDMPNGDASSTLHQKHPESAELEVGFQTGRGKKVQVSEASLQKAKKFLAEASEVPDQHIAIGFKTGHGKQVRVSETSLQKAKKLLEGEASITPDQNIAVGFRTGHGKKVQISEASLQRAKGFLAAGSNSISDQNKAASFQTGHEKKVQVSEAPLQRAKKFLADEVSEVSDQNIALGFQTGHGKKVQVSQASLQRAKKFLADEASEVPDKNIALGFQTGHGKKVQVSEASLQRAKKFLADEASEVPDQNIAIGFQTGHGKKVQVSEASLQRAKKFLADEASEIPDKNIALGFQTGHGKKVQVSQATLHRVKKFLADEASEVPDQNIAIGFQTAHGKKVQVSETSLQRAKKLFADEASKVSDQQTAIGFQTGHGKKVQVSEASLQRAKKFLADEVAAIPDQNLAIGFQTGHGKKVHVSEASLQRAKQILADASGTSPDEDTAVGLQTEYGKMSDVETEVLSNDPTVSGETCEESLSKKSSMMTGFMTGDGRKVHESEASLQHAKNNLDSEAFTDDVSRELSKWQLPPASQQQTLSSSADGDSPTHGRKDLKEDNFQCKLGREPLKGDYSHANLPSQKHLTGGLTKRGLVDMRNRQSNQQGNRRGSLPTGQKPYKPPRRVSEKVSSSSRGLIPRGSNPTVILNDRTKPLKALQSSPPHSSSHSMSSGRLKETGPFVKSSLDINTTNQSQAQLEATPIPEDGACSFVARWEEARRAQQQRINEKKGRLIKPELGSLWRCRKQDDRISLRDFVNHQYPCSMSDSQLFGNGILCSTLSVRPSNAEGYEFAGEDHFSPTCLESNQGILLADGGRLVFNPSGLAGKKEFYNALLDTPGVDPKLLKEEWVSNHYKWIIWKAAAMEVAYPLQFGGRFLTPNWVLLQLKYRYDREIDHSQRPALRKILERDDASSRRMVLCVAAINDTGSSTQNQGKSTEQSKSSQPLSHPTLELTDGWYSVSTTIDPPLANYVRSGKILCGTKLCIYGAELIGSQDACSPLEIPESLKLKIAANSTRRARYDARLGLQADPRPFPLPMTSLHPDGGSVGCIDVLILRTYPMQFMEKLPEGGSVFRNAKEEAKAAALHASRKQNKMEQLFTQVQKQFEAKQSHKVKGRRSLPSPRGRNSSELERLQSGEELFEALEAAIDPSAFESDLSEYQRCVLHAYQRSLNDMKQANLQAAFNQALAQQNKEGKFERNVVPLLKVRVADYRASTTRGQQTTFLTIWRPADDLVSLLVEGKRFRISSLSTSAGRNMPGMGPVQLASTRATRYEEIPAATHILQRSYIPRAAASMQWLGRGYIQAAYGELDVVGVVVSLDEPRQHPGSSHSHVVYIADQDTAVMAIKFWTSPAALNLDDMLKPGIFISASNLLYRSINQSAVVLPMATASDYTLFTPNPKATYLQVSINRLRQAIKDIPKFVEMMERKVHQLKDVSSQPAYPSSIPRNHPYMAKRERVTTPLATQSQARIGTQPTQEVPHGQGYQLMTVRSCPKNFMKTSKPIKDEMGNQRTQSTGISRVPSALTPVTPCQPQVPGAGVSPRLMAQHLEQERRSELLSRIPSPPPLTPLPCSAASPALRQGFKIPSPLVRISQKGEPEKSLRKRLRDELDEEDDVASERKYKKQSDTKSDDGNNTMKKQKVNNQVDTSNQETVASVPDNSNLERKIEKYEAKGEDDFDDDLGLSASGLRELEMGWSQSEVLTEPAVGDQPLEMNTSISEKDCPLECTNSMKEDTDPIHVDIRSENDNHHGPEPQDKHLASGSESVMEGFIQPCKDVTSGDDIKQGVVPCIETIQNKKLDDRATQNSDYPTDPTKKDSQMTLTDESQTTRTCKAEDSSSYSSSPLCESIDENVKEVSGCVTENAKKETDIQVEVPANLNSTRIMQETHAADNHLNLQGSASSDETEGATKVDNSKESSLLTQSRGMDDSSQNSTSINESQERSQLPKSSRSLSPKGNKRKCLSLQRKKAVVDSGAVIEILEDDNSPLPKRSPRLRVREKKSYKL